MDEQRSRTPEELTQDLLRAYLASESCSPPELGAPLENPSGMLAEFEHWGPERRCLPSTPGATDIHGTERDDEVGAAYAGDGSRRADARGRCTDFTPIT